MTFIDDRTAVYPLGTDVSGAGGFTTHTPTPSELDAVIATIDASAELAWTNNHGRFVTGYDDGDALTIVVRFACDVMPTDDPDPITALRIADGTDDGGDCYALAFFSSAGELQRWETNGEA